MDRTKKQEEGITKKVVGFEYVKEKLVYFFIVKYDDRSTKKFKYDPSKEPKRHRELHLLQTIAYEVTRP